MRSEDSCPCAILAPAIWAFVCGQWCLCWLRCAPPVLLSGLVAVHRPTEMALPPPWRLANPMPELSFEWHDYTATVRVPSCPAYSVPYPHGLRLSTTYRRGTSVRVVDVQVSACGTYLSALTAKGEWINVWTLTNLRGEQRGVNFCRLTANPPRRRWRPV